MNEQNLIRNSLEEMKNDLKSLLGIKRNKEPTAVELNSSTEKKKEINFKEEKNYKKIETNKTERQIIFDKDNENFVDITLDENHQPNLNNIQENLLNENIEENKQNNINDVHNIIENSHELDNYQINYQKLGEPHNNQAEITNTEKANFIATDTQVGLKKDASPNLLNNDNQYAKENELNNKKEEINSPNIKEIFQEKNEKIYDEKIIVNNIEDKEVNEKPEYITIEPKTEPLLKTNEKSEKEEIKADIPLKPSGFNLFNIENLSMPKENLIELFKAPEKNVFEDINMHNKNFFVNKSLDKDDNNFKELEEENNTPDNYNQKQIKNESQQKDSEKEDNLIINKQEEPQNEQKTIIDKAPKVERVPFSLDMVPGFESQREEIMKIFSKQEEIKNPFGLGFANTNSNIFIKIDNSQEQSKNLNNSSENKTEYVISESKLIIEQKLEQVSNSNPTLSLNAKAEEVSPNPNQIRIASENNQIYFPILDANLTSISQNENYIKENHTNNDIVPMNIDRCVEVDNKKEENINDNAKTTENIHNNEMNTSLKINAHIEKKIIISSKIDQIISKKLEKTAYNNEEKPSLEVTMTQKQPENKINNINEIENRVLINTQNEIKKEVITTIPKNNFGYINDTAFKSNTNTNLNNNNINTIGENTIENKNQPLNQVAKKIIIEEKEILQPLNPIYENKTEKENINQKEITGNKEVKSELLHIKSNVPEKPSEIKSIEVDKKDSTISVSSVLKDPINAKIESNKPDSQLPSEQNITKQASAPEPGKKRAITFQEAKEQIDKFSDLINNLEIEMRDKYGINIPQVYYEDSLPEQVKIKLVEDFFNDKDIVDLGKQLSQKLEEKK
jgi:hypothetical protein